MSEEANYIKVGMSSCGTAAGAEEVYKGLLDFVKEKSIPVEIKKTGCIGMCYAEPIIEVKIGQTPSIIYKQVNKDLALNILENALLNKESFAELVIQEHPKQKKIVLRNCGKIDLKTSKTILKTKDIRP
ncbi:MAG: (2Fe-2S) ferredoxin domain-containing protein [Candidatus Gastranaerophilaceae bacterium]|jgi:(2Fe-2S) ferredoxin